MRQAFQLVEGQPREIRAARLPLAATANDVRGVVQYLKNRPAGVTLGEAIGAMKKQSFDQKKLASYEALGITVRSGDRLKLSPLGLELARCLEPEITIFRHLLDNFPPYRGVLEWADGEELEVLVQTDVEEHWRRYYVESLGPCTERTAEGSVVCFFQLCQAAAIGTHILGKKGQPTRLRLDREELHHYVLMKGALSLDEGTEDKFTKTRKATPRTERDKAEPGEAAGPRGPVFISSRREAEIVGRIQEALHLADFVSCVSPRQEAGDLPVATALLAAMRQCQAGIIVIERHDCRKRDDGGSVLKDEVQTEIGAAFVLYDRRLLLVLEREIPLPANLQGVSHCRYEAGRLSWEAGVELIKTVKSFGLITAGR